jgi:hypothetical protein
MQCWWKFRIETDFIILYINKANNNDSVQVVLILGISGACRGEELVKLTIDDIEDKISK